MIESIKESIDVVKYHNQRIKNVKTPISQLTPTISYKAIDKSIKATQNITNFFFPLLSISENIYPQLMPILVFVEATIYQIDEEYENNLNNPKFISKHMY